MCCFAQVDVMDVRLCSIRIDEEKDADTAREAVVDGTLTRVKERNEVKACNAEHTRR